MENIKPQVRFSGKGVIIPAAGNLSVPFEAVNLRAVDVRAIRIYENNIPQFLQVNDLAGTYELQRVGKVVWRKVVPIELTNAMRDRWVRCAFDVTPLLAKEPNALYRIELSFSRTQAVYPCAGIDTSTLTQPQEQSETEEEENLDYDNYNEGEGDYYNSSEDGEWNDFYNHREDPCHKAYYFYNGGGRGSSAHIARNFIASNFGLVAKRGADDTVRVAVTDLLSAQPMSGVDIRVQNFQHQNIGSGKSNGSGFCPIKINGKPYLLVADNGKQKGWLRIDDGSVLSMSQFDVGGAAPQRGLKGLLYGERGVWRPGDSLFLTFLLEDKTNRLPKNHPVTFELISPRGQIVQSLTRTESVGGMYNFATTTAPDAPTGNYTARVKVGGAAFEQTLKIEAVMPNRLKVQLSFGSDTIFAQKGTVKGSISSRWLHGASARGLKADVEMSLSSAATSFPRYKGFTFDDPIRSFASDTRMIFENNLGADGSAQIQFDLGSLQAPGMLRAAFRSRVFEPGGAFSVSRASLPIYPYSKYVGIKLPQPDRGWGALFIDTVHSITIAAADGRGKAASVRKVQVSLYKTEWHWWWERGGESQADYVNGRGHRLVKVDTIAVNNEAQWRFRVNRPDWGRYLIRAVDLDGGHASGCFFYLDWPDDYGRPPMEGGEGAKVLAISSDKEEYVSGEKAVFTVPSSEKSRILVSIENGSRVLQWFWADAAKGLTRIALDISPDMAPTAYISIAHIQPHGQTVNDLPLRMYGVIPINVVDPQTKLAPKISAPQVMRPGEKASISVSEASGREMAYTLAIVDEGLLDLTGFKTPDLWEHFHQREALGVKSWDLFDLVCGAYGAKLERLLAIGGDEGVKNPGQKRGNRFPPMVRFIGPMLLAKGAVARHEIAVPQYVGSVRVMAVAGYKGAYGKTESTIPVRSPLMILGTLPRVLGPEETARLPVSVFALEPTVKDVTVSLEVSGAAAINGPASTIIHFKQPGDELAIFEIKAASGAGPALVKLHASGNGQNARQDIAFEIRLANRPMVDVVDTVIAGRKTWSGAYKLPGIAGTNSAILEVSSIPPLNLGKRLDYLVCYPHGCVEQVTSSVFPQLYIDKLTDVPNDYRVQIQRNVQAGIEKLRSFQTSQGGFTYWPGCGYADDWASSYAGHFITEAAAAGYGLPQGMQQEWIRYQQRQAIAWNNSMRYTELNQAYRLFTLALALKPELGAMNRLRESSNLPTAARWRLAAAYGLAGQGDAARELLRNATTELKPYRESNHTYGSDFRDRAMMLETMVLLKDQSSAAVLAKKIGEQLSANYWLSTQETSYALLAMAKFLGKEGTSGKIDIAVKHNGAQPGNFMTSAIMLQRPLTLSTGAQSGIIEVRNNTDGFAYVRLILKGIPATGKETPGNAGIIMKARYLRRNGTEFDPVKIEQGMDFTVEVSVAAQDGQGPFDQIALSQIFPSGWEIRNTRLEQLGENQSNSGFDYQDIRDDRVYTYFSIPSSGVKIYRISLNASYIGRYYLPTLYCEAMYDETINARIPGKWVEVLEAGK